MRVLGQKGIFVMFRLLTIILFLFCLLTTTMVFGRSTQYFENTLFHMVGNECNKKSRQEIIKSEIDKSVILLLQVMINELNYKLMTLQKKSYD